MSAPTTDKYVAAEGRLAAYLMDKGEPVQTLADWILALRGAGRSDREIAARMYAATRVSVTHETIRTWFPHEKRQNGDGEQRLVGAVTGA